MTAVTPARMNAGMVNAPERVGMGVDVRVRLWGLTALAFQRQRRRDIGYSCCIDWNFPQCSR